MCHGVGVLRYDNDLYNRTRLNPSVKSLFGNRKETTKECCLKKNYKSPLGKTDDKSYMLPKKQDQK